MTDDDDGMAALRSLMACCGNPGPDGPPVDFNGWASFGVGTPNATWKPIPSWSLAPDVIENVPPQE